MKTTEGEILLMELIRSMNHAASAISLIKTGDTYLKVSVPVKR